MSTTFPSSPPPPLVDDFQCPFVGTHRCTGYSPTLGPYNCKSWKSHMKNVHLSTPRHSFTRTRLQEDPFIFTLTSRLLLSNSLWLCWQNDHVGQIVATNRKCRLCSSLPPPSPHFPISGIDPPQGVFVEDFNFPLPTPLAPEPHLALIPPLPSALVVDDTQISIDILDKFFRLRIPTIRSIPKRCRFQVAEALFQTFKGVTEHPNDEKAWILLLLFPLCVLHRVPRRERFSRNKVQMANILRALQYWNEGEAGKILLFNHLLESHSSFFPPQKSISPSSHQIVLSCKRKAMSGQYGTALKILSQTGLAPPNDATFLALTTLHPPSSSTLNSSTLESSFPDELCSNSIVLQCLRSFPKDTAPGGDGFRPQHLLDCFRGSASGFQSLLLEQVKSLVFLLLNGQCPGTLAPFIASAPLTALRKKDHGVRPIAVGLIWRRLASKVALKSVIHDAKLFLGDFQFGVGFKGGGEAIIHSTNRFLASFGTSMGMTLAAIDFSNAFNEIHRPLFLKVVVDKFPHLFPWVSFTYGQPGRLYFDEKVIMSSTGVQQGDPLGPLLFSLGLHSILHEVRSNCTLNFMAWYLDDGTLIGPTVEVSKAIKIIEDLAPISGLKLNYKKTSLFWPLKDPLWDDVSHFSPNFSQTTEGIVLLGATATLSTPFLHSVVSQRVEKILTLLQKLEELNDPQIQLLLLRSCVGIPKFVYTLRTSPPQLISSQVMDFDHGLRQSLLDIVGFGGQGFADFHWKLSGLPCRFGGLGILHASTISRFAYLQSISFTSSLQLQMLRLVPDPPPYVSYIEEAMTNLKEVFPSFDLTLDYFYSTPIHDAFYQFQADRLRMEVANNPRYSLILNLSQRPHASDVWFALPLGGLSQTLDPRPYRLGLRYRLGLPVYSKISLCPRCQTTRLDSLGDHAVHCPNNPGFKARHDGVRDTLASLFYEGGIQVVKEAPVSFLTEQNLSSLRPADLLIPGWINGKPTCVDVVGVSPFVQGHNGAYLGESNLSRSVQAKLSKHQAKCEENHHAFVPFGFDTFGGFAPEAIRMITRLQRSLTQEMQTRDGVASRYAWRRLSFSIFRGVALQLNARWPD